MALSMLFPQTLFFHLTYNLGFLVFSKSSLLSFVKSFLEQGKEYVIPAKSRESQIPSDITCTWHLKHGTDELSNEIETEAQT